MRLPHGKWLRHAYVAERTPPATPERGEAQAAAAQTGAKSVPKGRRGARRKLGKKLSDAIGDKYRKRLWPAADSAGPKAGKRVMRSSASRGDGSNVAASSESKRARRSSGAREEGAASGTAGGSDMPPPSDGDEASGEQSPRDEVANPGANVEEVEQDCSEFDVLWHWI